MSNTKKIKKIIAISSGGGHWIQMLRLRKAFSECDVVYVTVDKGYHKIVADSKFYKIIDANQDTKFSLLITAINILYIVIKERADIIISTGAAPGYFGILFGKIFGAKTIWIDSIANSECLSLSGAKVRKFADLYLTQWEHLAKEDGPYYSGSIL
ncbi:MAG: UDP-N-acetylglucosamine--LPS N-acetylglucosamine transferase [Candidatus Hodarchaeota archaeon]